MTPAEEVKEMFQDIGPVATAQALGKRETTETDQVAATGASGTADRQPKYPRPSKGRGHGKGMPSSKQAEPAATVTEEEAGAGATTTSPGLQTRRMGQSVLQWPTRKRQPPRVEQSARPTVLGSEGELRPRPTTRGQNGGEHKDAHSSVPSARGRAFSNLNRAGLHSYLRDEVGSGPSKDVQDCNGLEGEEGAELGRLLPAQDLIHCSAADVARENAGVGVGRSSEEPGDSPGLCGDPAGNALLKFHSTRRMAE